MNQNLIAQKSKYLLFFLIVPIIVSCASHKKVNKLTSQLNCNKTVHFVFDEASNFVKIEYKGEHIGKSKYPDYKKTFRESVEELNRNSQATLINKEAIGIPMDSITQVSVRIEKIVWDFNFSSALMEAELVYTMSGQKINIIGNNKVFMAGTKKGSLLKSLKHGNYIFLTILCDELKDK